MRHYEIVLIVHPDQSEQVPAMLEKYKKLITEKGGSIHRVEDWGRRVLAHPIVKLHKAHYLLMNIEIDQSTLDDIASNFKFNDAVLRNLIIKRDEAISTKSPLGREREDELKREQSSTRTPQLVKEVAPVVEQQAQEDVKADDVQEEPKEPAEPTETTES